MNFRSCALWLAGMSTALAAHGQLIIDSGETYPISDDSIFMAKVYVGYANSGNGLMIDDNIVAWGQTNLYVGYSSSSSSNWVDLGDNSQLLLDGVLYLGYDGSGNDLSAQDAAVVEALGGVSIGHNVDSDDNHALISGNGSALFSGRDLYVGLEGANNRLEVSDGAFVYTAGSVFVGLDSLSANNSIELSDSTLYANLNVIVGFDGPGNQLQVLDGAVVDSINGYVGVTNDADNNLVFISGAGSVWTNYGRLYIGNADNTGNSVTVTNGGSVVAYNGLQIDGTGNTFNLERGGSLDVYSDFDAAMDGFAFNEGSALYVGGVLSNATAAIEGERTLGIIGFYGWWNLLGSNLVVGGTSSNNLLDVAVGGWVEADDVAVGSGAAVSGNTVSVTGRDSLLNITGSLTIGSASNAANRVDVSDGGTVLLGGDLLIGNAGNAFNLGSGGWLVASNGLDAAQPGFNFMDGGTLESLGVLTGLTNTLEGQRTVFLTGSNAVWDLGVNALELGDASSYNTVSVLGGARLSSAGGVLGNAATVSNLILVADPGSIWTNSGSLALDGYYNDLIVTNGGFVTVGQTLSVRNQAALAFESGGHAAAANYFQDESSVFAFQSVTNTPASPALLVVDNTAEFEAGATLEYTGALSGLERGVVFTNRLVQADTLIVNGVTNATTADLDALNITGLGSLLTIDLVSESDDLIALINRMRLADSAGFAPGSEMAGVSEEIDLMADAGDPRAEHMLEVLSQLDSNAQNAQLSQLYDRRVPSYSHVKGMMDGFKQARMRGVVPGPMLPQGAFGPHFYGSQAQGWIKGYGSWGARDSSSRLPGYDQNVYGVVIGVDQSYGDLLAGIAGGWARSEIDQDDGDNSESTTGYGMAYASWGTVSWFGDLNFGYGRSSIKDTSGSLFDTTADYDADQLGFYAGGGKEMVFAEDNLFITPSAALSGSYFLQDSYVEKSTTAVPRSVDDFDYFSLKSEVGLKTSYAHELNRSVLVPELHANWLHEFNADEERIGYSLVGGSGRYTFGMQAPVEDIYEIGTGLSWWMRNSSRQVFEWNLGLDGRFGDGYTETTASLRLLTQF